MTAPLSSKKIHQLFKLLNAKLAEKNIQGEIFLVGGAVMCLVFEARQSTRDLDAYFKPAKQLREAATKVAAENNISENWLNDSVKGFMSTEGNFKPYLQLSHLKIFTAEPSYLLAMKCLAARIGEEFYDIDDIRYLLRYLNITKLSNAEEIIAQYYPLEKFPQKTFYLLEELLPA